ncbi:transcription-repair coupling factor [Puteibacter caeruleilacunae]|nr:transcription-repair coupling factor [Puteibacter caeruleilacunae]
MNQKELLKIFAQHPQLKKIETAIQEKSNSSIGLNGLVGSSVAMLTATLFPRLRSNLVVILDDREEASYFIDDIRTLGTEQCTFFPSSFKRSIQYRQVDHDHILNRTETLNTLSSQEEPIIIVTYPEALVEQVISDDSLVSNTLHINQGEKLSVDFVNEVLLEYGFERVDFVYEPGQFSIRGSIVDIFSFSHEDPYRVDFFGEEIESIRSFDVENQISRDRFETISIVPDIQLGMEDEKRVSFFEFIRDDSILISKNTTFLFDRVEQLHQQYINSEPSDNEQAKLKIESPTISGTQLREQYDNFRTLELSQHTGKEFDCQVSFDTTKQPIFHKNFDLLGNNLKENTEKGYTNIILFPNQNQVNRLHAIFDDKGEAYSFEETLFVINEGFVDHDLQVCFYTDHQIFERYHRFKTKGKRTSKESISLKELNKLHPGDYVVHIDHGIGKFAGLVKMEVNGKMQEVIRLEYRESDVLFVSIHSLHRISKYKGKDGQSPKINKLGTGAWQKMKNKAKSKVKDIAKELIALYAERKAEKGFAFSPDSYLQQELEASFIYEDTPDQEKATNAVKTDMEKVTPMDRLVCGDVGFGKTEVAIRAAFKAVADSKQVAILVPTTILALQHYKTFCDRLKELPANIEYVSRLRKAADITRIKKELKAGTVDIIIGTHRLVNKDIQFKDLGLLIIDEEQKFGVSVKEKLKRLKVNVDTLTLTATPIPRTLQFSLMGARDLSIINTPPPNRYPIITELHGFNEEIIRESINYELARGGQVFFINNRIQNIFEIEALIKRICPKARTIVGHGQMEGPKLEKIMLDFIHGQYDVLVATTIIESGLDIPNANTIIINNAQNFGLSELHQLRGRVGRSNKKAFCYLLAPPLTTLPADSRRRLQAIEQFSELGSGFNIAMQDLDIRGAGNLLGGEQSGFIADIGFETYHKILNEAIQELKQGEFKDLFEEEDPASSEVFLNVKFVNDCQVDTDMELLFPDEFISSITERMQLYRQLDNITDEEALQAFEHALVDRFGKIPEQTKELMEVVRLRWTAINLGMEKIIIKNNIMICHFIANQESPFYQSPVFQDLLQYIMANPKLCRMKEAKDKLSIRFEKIKSIQQALRLLTEMNKHTHPDS